MRSSLLFLCFVSMLSALGCSPQIGSGCGNSTNCSINGDRLCDTSQPGGSCIVYDCQPDRCPDNAVCVRFNPDPPRQAVVGCMKRCGQTSDCRAGEGYVCVGASDFPLPPLDPEPQTDDGGTDPDAGVLPPEMPVDPRFANLQVEIVDRNRPDGHFCMALPPE